MGGVTRGAPKRSVRARSAGLRSAPKVQRWIDLLAALLSRRFPAAFDDLARDVPAYRSGQKKGALSRMFERDKDELRAFGVPIESVPMAEGEQTGYRLRGTNFYLPYLAVAAGRGGGRGARGASKGGGYSALAPLAFEPDELAAVADASARVCILGDPMLRADAESAMRKLAFDLPVDAAKGSEGERIVPSRDRVDPALFVALGRALTDRKRVRFDYRAMASDATSRRSVEPYGLFFLSAHWYLAGHDRDRDGLRNFRLSRMAGAEVNAARSQTPDYEIPADFRLRDHARSRQPWELGGQDAGEAVVEFRADTGAVRGAAKLGEAIAGEPNRRRFVVRRPDAFARWLLSFAGGAVPVSPPALVDEYRELARRTLSVYAGADSNSE
ncbi:MAG: WYL domain-containing protein [Gemmatimonadaceae bacterium]